MARSFRDDLAVDLAETFFNVGELGETVTFFPAGGGTSRQIVCDVRHTGQLADTEAGIDAVEELRVFVSNDEALANSAGATIGGIESPQVGDQLVREGRPETEKFTYTGQVVKSDRVSWTLLFRRRVPYQVGGQHQRR